MAKICGSEVKELSALNENAVLGWRFWAAFLGIGYSETVLPIGVIAPNPVITTRLNSIYFAQLVNIFFNIF